MTKKREWNDWHNFGGVIVFIGFIFFAVFLIWGTFMLGEFLSKFIGIWGSLGAISVVIIAVGSAIFMIGERQYEKATKKTRQKNTKAKA